MGSKRKRPSVVVQAHKTEEEEPRNFDLRDRRTATIVKISHPENFDKKLLKPEYLCKNLQTGQIDVDPAFFWQVWEEYSTDDTWHGWVAFRGKKVTGLIILQGFVHESEYFRWGKPLNRLAAPPIPETGEILNVGEITLLCAKGCGSLLLKEVLDWVKFHTKYEFIVVSSTIGALQWYLSKGFKRVKAYRLPKGKPGLDLHLYRHRIADFQLNLQHDIPSIMLYIPVQREDSLPQEQPSKISEKPTKKSKVR